MRIVSIDPGISGGLAVLELEEGGRLPTIAECMRMPTLPRKKDGTGEKLNQAALSAWLDRVQPAIVVLEHVTGMRNRRDAKTCKACKRPFGPGSSGLVNFGIGYGVLIGVAAKYPQVYVSPSQWKKRLGVPSASEHKDAARALALQWFPYLAEQLTRKKDVGVAEAVLIGYDYCRELADLDPLTRASGAAMIVPKSYTLELDL